MGNTGYKINFRIIVTDRQSLGRC